MPESAGEFILEILIEILKPILQGIFELIFRMYFLSAIAWTVGIIIYSIIVCHYFPDSGWELAIPPILCLVVWFLYPKKVNRRKKTDQKWHQNLERKYAQKGEKGLTKRQQKQLRKFRSRQNTD